MSVACLLGAEAWLRCEGSVLQLWEHGELQTSLDAKQLPREGGEPLNLPNATSLRGVCERDGVVLLSDGGNFCGLALRSAASKSAGLKQWFSQLQVQKVLFDEFSGNYAETTDGAFQLPAGCCVGPCGFWYVVDEEGARVNVYDCDGGDFVAALGSGFGDAQGELDHPTDVVQLSATAVAVLDAGNGRVQVFQVYPPSAPVEDPLDVQEDEVAHVTHLDTSTAICIAAVGEGQFVVADGARMCLLQGGAGGLAQQGEGGLRVHTTDDAGHDFAGPLEGVDSLGARVAVLRKALPQFTSEPFRTPPSPGARTGDGSDSGLSEASSLPGDDAEHRTPGAAGGSAEGLSEDEGGEGGGIDPFAESSDSGGSSPPPVPGAGQDSTGVLDTLTAAKLLAAQRMPSDGSTSGGTGGASASSRGVEGGAQRPLSHVPSGGTMEGSLPDDMDEHAARIQAVFRGHQSRTRARLNKGSPRPGEGGVSDADSSSLDPFASDDDSGSSVGGGGVLLAETAPSPRDAAAGGGGGGGSSSGSGSASEALPGVDEDASAGVIQAAFRAKQQRQAAAASPQPSTPDADVTLANQPWLRNSESLQSLSTDGGLIPVEGGSTVGGVGHASRGSGASPLTTPRLPRAGGTRNTEHKEPDAEEGVVAVQSAWRGRRERAAVREAAASPVRQLNATLNRSAAAAASSSGHRDAGASSLRGIPAALAAALGPKALRRLHDMPPGQAAQVAASVARSNAKARVAAAKKHKARRQRGGGDRGGRGSPSMDVADEIVRLRAGANTLRTQLEDVEKKNKALARELSALAGVPVEGGEGSDVVRAEPPPAYSFGEGGAVDDAPSYSGVTDTTWLEMRCMQLSSRIAVLEQERSSGAWRPSGAALREAARAAEHAIHALHKFVPGLTAAAEAGRVPSETQLLRQIRATRLSVASLGETNDELQALLDGASAPPAASVVQRSKQQLAADMAQVQAEMDDTRKQLAAATASANKEQAAVAALVQRRAVLRAMLAETQQQT